MTSVVVIGGVFCILCLGVITLFWFTKRQIRKQKLVLSLLSENIAMDQIRSIPDIEDDLFTTEGGACEGRVRNKNPGNIHLGSVRITSSGSAMNGFHTSPNMEDEL